MLEACRDLTRVCVVVDLDMFFAAVEMRDDPSLRDKPMAVGGMGMISTANYAARKFGVRSAMPGFIAVKLCPALVFVKPNYSKYVEVAKHVRAVFATYDPQFRAASLDEAYLDLTEHLAERGVLPRASTPSCETGRAESAGQQGGRVHAQGTHAEHSSTAALAKPKCTSMIKGYHPTPQPEQAAPNRIADLPTLDAAEANVQQHAPNDTLASGDSLDGARAGIEAAVAEMRAEIERVTQITASAGIGPNPMLAKIASDFNKPNGQYFVPFNRAGVMHFVGNLPIRKIPFIGKVSEALLRQAFGVSTGAQLLQKLPDIYLTLSANQRTFLHRSCLGIADTSRNEQESHRRKSVSQERTFGNCHDADLLRGKCTEIAAKVSAMMLRGDPARGTSWEFFGSSDEGVGWQDTAARAEHMDANQEHADVEDGTDGDETTDPGDDGVPRVPYRGKTVTLKLKLSNFKVLSRQVQLPRLTNSAAVISAAGIELLNKEISAAVAGGVKSGLTLRLMGVRMSALVFDDEIENSPLVKFLQGSAQGDDSAHADAAGGGIEESAPPPGSASRGPRKLAPRGSMDAFMVPAHVLARSHMPPPKHMTAGDEVISLDDDCSQDTPPARAAPPTQAKTHPPSSAGTNRGSKRERPEPLSVWTSSKSARKARGQSSTPAAPQDGDVLDLTLSPPAAKCARPSTNAPLPCPVGVALAVWAALPTSIQSEVSASMKSGRWGLGGFK